MNDVSLAWTFVGNQLHSRPCETRVYRLKMLKKMPVFLYCPVSKRLVDIMPCSILKKNNFRGLTEFKVVGYKLFSLQQPLYHRRNIASLSLPYRYFHIRGISLVQTITIRMSSVKAHGVVSSSSSSSYSIDKYKAVLREFFLHVLLCWIWSREDSFPTAKNLAISSLVSTIVYPSQSHNIHLLLPLSTYLNTHSADVVFSEKYRLSLQKWHKLMWLFQ